MASAPTAIWFPGWAEKLQQLRLPALIGRRYRLAIIRYLRFCKQSQQQATVESARQFIREVEEDRRLGRTQLEHWREALRWFFKEGGKTQGGTAGLAVRNFNRVRGVDPARPTHVIADVPTLGAADMGKTDWERRLVRELRFRHYQWRTEQTYRQWAWRFANWLRARARTVEEAGADDVRTFLEQLAVRQRISASSQKQALNALVFLLRETLRRKSQAAAHSTNVEPLRKSIESACRTRTLPTRTCTTGAIWLD